LALRYSFATVEQSRQLSFVEFCSTRDRGGKLFVLDSCRNAAKPAQPFAELTVDIFHCEIGRVRQAANVCHRRNEFQVGRAPFTLERKRAPESAAATVHYQRRDQPYLRHQPRNRSASKVRHQAFSRGRRAVAVMVFVKSNCPRRLPRKKV